MVVRESPEARATCDTPLRVRGTSASAAAIIRRCSHQAEERWLHISFEDRARLSYQDVVHNICIRLFKLFFNGLLAEILVQAQAAQTQPQQQKP